MMTKSISDLASEAGFSGIAGTNQYPEYVEHRLQRFAALVAKAEREACAKVVEEFPHDQLGCLDEVVAAIRGQR